MSVKRYSGERDSLFDVEYVLATDFDALAKRLEEATGRWIEWKPGNTKPCYGYWIVTVRSGYRAPFVSMSMDDSFESNDVIAYWSIQLPPPYEARP